MAESQIPARGLGHGVPLIGREREATALWWQYLQATEGRANVALIAGEPGIGKSRLLDQLAERATAAGATTLRGGASAATGMPPYLPFLEAMGAYLRRVPMETLREQLGQGAAILATIFPELPARFALLPAAYPLPPEQSRLRLFEAVGDLLAAIATTAPVLLILDDLHWADATSLDLLCHLLRQHPQAQLLVTGAYRDDEVGDNTPLARALTELNRLRILTTIGAGRLLPAETALLARALLAGEPDAGLVGVLHEQSEGNPFFAEEIVRGWHELGLLRQAGEQWRLTSSFRPPSPQTILDAIQQRLARLDPSILAPLRTAAIVGRTFDAPLLAEVVGLDLDQLEESLALACRARLLRDNGDGTFTFGHDRIRECLYGETTANRRRRLHQAIGMALERSGAAPTGEHLTALAFHFTRCGDRARGADYGLRAAAQSLRAYAPELARDDYRTALDLLASDDPRRGEALLGLGEALVLLGAPGDGAEAYEAAQDWFGAVGNRPLAARAAHQLGRARWRLEALPETKAALEKAIVLLGDDPGSSLVDVLSDLGEVLGVSLGQINDGLVPARRALALARELGDQRREATALRTVGNLLVRAGDAAQGRPLLRQALTLAEAVDDPSEAAECCAGLLTAAYWAGETKALLEAALQQVVFAERSHDLYQLRHVFCWIAATYTNLGRWDEAQVAIRRAQTVVDRLNSPEPRAYLEHMHGTMAIWHGDYAAAEAPLQGSAEAYRALNPAALIWYLGPLGVVQLAQGKNAAALASLTELEGLLELHPPDSPAALEALVCLGLMAARLADHQRAARYYPQLRPFSGRLGNFVVDRVLAQLAITLGDWHAAEGYLAAAEALALRDDWLPEQARLLVVRADLAVARGGRGSEEQARALLQDALARFTAIGWATDAAEVQDRLLLLPVQTASVGARPLPAGLSEREAEVLRRVAAGKSNRQIAAALFISEKTIANHLTSIFNKLGVDNRVAATAFAIRHGLTEGGER